MIRLSKRVASETELNRMSSVSIYHGQYWDSTDGPKQLSRLTLLKSASGRDASSIENGSSPASTAVKTLWIPISYCWIVHDLTSASLITPSTVTSVSHCVYHQHLRPFQYMESQRGYVRTVMLLANLTICFETWCSSLSPETATTPWRVWVCCRNCKKAILAPVPRSQLIPTFFGMFPRAYAPCGRELCSLARKMTSLPTISLLSLGNLRYVRPFLS